MDFEAVIKDAIKAVAARWDPDKFVSGDCHTLAIALHRASAPEGSPAARQGKLMACLRHTMEKGYRKIFDTTYSHMVYEDQGFVCWDIEGDFADENWEESIDTTTRDKWGMRNKVEWVEVPCAHPEYADTYAWLKEHCGVVNTKLENQLVREIRKVIAKASAPAEPELVC